jgi:hypothetical protein
MYRGPRLERSHLSSLDCQAAVTWVWPQRPSRAENWIDRCVLWSKVKMIPIVLVMTCSGGTAAFGKHGLIPSRVFLAPAPTTASSTDFHHRGLAKETDQIS